MVQEGARPGLVPGPAAQWRRIGTSGHVRTGRPMNVVPGRRAGAPGTGRSGDGRGANVALALLPRAQGVLVVEAAGATLRIQSEAGRRTGHLVELPLVAPRS